MYEIRYIIFMYIFHPHNIKWCVQEVNPCSDIKMQDTFH